MAKVYSWEIQKSPRQYAYIIDPNDINKNNNIYVGNELNDSNLQNVIEWVNNCTKDEYISQFNKIVDYCKTNNYNIKFNDVETYFDVNLSCNSLRGPSGRGISEIKLYTENNTSSTYRIYYDDDTHYDFTIKHGINGINGINGDIGAKGDNGVSTKTIIIYKSATSIEPNDSNEIEIDTPIDGSYDFITGEIEYPIGWNPSDENLLPPVYMSSRNFASNPAYTDKNWSKPIKITGDDGENGTDGASIEFIYKLTKDESEEPETPENVRNESDYIPAGWEDSPQGVTSEMTYEWVCIRKYDIVKKEWGGWSKPSPWSIYSVNGQDGDGVQYIYLRNNGEQPQNPTPRDYYNINGDFTESYQEKNNEWVPPVNEVYFNIYNEEVKFNYVDENGNGGIWTDSPQGVNENLTHEWVCVRKYTNYLNTPSIKTWGAFSEPTLWAKYGKNGESGKAIRKLYRLTDSEKDIPTVPNTSTDTGLWSVGFPKDYITKGGVVWSTESLIYVDTNEFVEDGWCEPFIVNGLKGKDGKDGETGPVGPQGASGLPGDSFIQLFSLGTEKESLGKYEIEDLNEKCLRLGFFDSSKSKYWFSNKDIPNTDLFKVEFSDTDSLNEFIINNTECHGRVVEVSNKYGKFYYFVGKNITSDDIDSNKAFIPYDGSNIYLWCIQGVAKYKENNYINDIEWSEPFKIQGVNGLNGVNGNRGQITYPMGVYNPNEIYITTKDKAPYVYDSNDGLYYVYNVVNEPWVGTLPDEYETILIEPDDIIHGEKANYYITTTNPLSVTNRITDGKYVKIQNGSIYYWSYTNKNYVLYDENDKTLIEPSEENTISYFGLPSYRVTDCKYVLYENKYYTWDYKQNKNILASKYKYSIDSTYGNWIEDKNGITPAIEYANAISNNESPKWVRFESFDAIYTSLGIIANGMIGSCVYNNEFMFSQYGLDTTGGTSQNYELFLSGYNFNENPLNGKHWYKKINGQIVHLDDVDVDPYEMVNGEPLHDFRPNVCINFKTGQMWLSSGEIKFGEKKLDLINPNLFSGTTSGLTANIITLSGLTANIENNLTLFTGETNTKLISLSGKTENTNTNLIELSGKTENIKTNFESFSGNTDTNISTLKTSLSGLTNNFTTLNTNFTKLNKGFNVNTKKVGNEEVLENTEVENLNLTGFFVRKPTEINPSNIEQYIATYEDENGIEKKCIDITKTGTIIYIRDIVNKDWPEDILNKIENDLYVDFIMFYESKDWLRGIIGQHVLIYNFSKKLKIGGCGAEPVTNNNDIAIFEINEKNDVSLCMNWGYGKYRKISIDVGFLDDDYGVSPTLVGGETTNNITEIFKLNVINGTFDN